ncbi:MAG: hypothetical protein H7Z72_21970 [Bacteroidetes bacterium]|nr:hypothetical protein [Fibrella sp.]
MICWYRIKRTTGKSLKRRWKNYYPKRQMVDMVNDEINYVQRYHHSPLSQGYVDHRPSNLTALEASWSQKTSVPIVAFLHSQLLWLLEESIDLLLNEQKAD